MSTRRTRRNLGSENESKTWKLRQIQSKKEALPIVGDVCSVKVDDSIANDLSAHSDEEVKPQAVSNDVDEETNLKEKSLWNGHEKESLLEKDRLAEKTDALSLPISDNRHCESMRKKVLTEIINVGNKSIKEETSKSKKSEILVSLLESETFPCGKLRTLFDQKYADDNENILCKKAHYSLKDGDLLKKSIKPCIFPYCEQKHKQSSKKEFMTIPEVPEEPFLVSLSKDKNKELNMVTTSSGTLRVGPGCGMRRFLNPGPLFLGSSNKPSISSTLQSEVDTDKENKRANSLMPEVSKSMTSTEIVSKGIQQSAKYDSPEESEGDNGICAITGSCLSKDLKVVLTHLDFKSFKSEPVDEKLHIGKSLSSSSLNTSHTSSILDTTLENESEYLSDLATSRKAKKPHNTDDILLSSDEFENKILQTNMTLSPSPCNYDAVDYVRDIEQIKSDKTPGQSCVIITESSSTQDLSHLPHEYDAANLVKRSERIRCKAKSLEEHEKYEGKVSLPSVQEEDKYKTTQSDDSQESASSDKKLMNKTQKCNKNKKKGSSSKNAKTPGKQKPQMTRKVIDGIVQSIEETVLRASQDSCLTDRAELKSSGGRQNKTLSKMTSSEEADVSDNLCSGIPMGKKNSYISHNVISSYETSVAQGTDCQSVPKKNNAKKHKKKTKEGKTLSEGSIKEKKDKITSSEENKVKIKSDSGSNVICALEASNISTERVPKIYAEHETNHPEEQSEIIQNEETPNSSSANIGKRFRKRTKKAREAYENTAIFLEDEMKPKKSKPKKRTVSEGDLSIASTKRSKRSNQMGELMSDPVLEQHAFILWASENRSQVESQNPGSSVAEVEAILSSRWCDVVGSSKFSFFLRAREAFSDRGRQVPQPTPQKEPSKPSRPETTLDHDPLFIEFMNLPVDKQRDMLRKWLKFFQRMLPKKEYIDFIVTFKAACGETEDPPLTPGKQPKRPRMRCLDPTHYRMLFDMIRLTRPRVAEVCQEKRGRERKMISQMYSMILHRLVQGEPWPPAADTSFALSGHNCQSQSLTEVLLDLSIEVDTVLDYIPISSESDCGSGSLPSMSIVTGPAGDFDSTLGMLDNPLIQTVCAPEEINLPSPTQVTLSSSHSYKWIHKQDEIAFQASGELACDFGIGQSDYACLDTDLAHNLLFGLSELSELPVIDQTTLDQMFLAPPRREVKNAQARRGGNTSANTSNSSLCVSLPVSSPLVYPQPPPNLFQKVFSSTRLLHSDRAMYPKMNIHHYPLAVPAFEASNQQIPSPYHLDPEQYKAGASVATSSLIGTSIAASRQTLPRIGKHASTSSPACNSTSSTSSKVPSSSCSLNKKSSLMDMHSYSISRENSNTFAESSSTGSKASNFCCNRSGPPDLFSNCIKVHPKSMMGPTSKLSVQALHYPLPPHNSPASSVQLSHGVSINPPQSSRQQHPRIVPAAADYRSNQQQRILPDSVIAKPHGYTHSHNHHTSSSRLGSQIYSIRGIPPILGQTPSCSRVYPQHPSSPLITSLSPLRSIRHLGSSDSKMSPCTMLPYKPRVQLAEPVLNSTNTSQYYRRPSHGIPISTTLDTFGSSRSQGCSNIQEIKVCLPTQALKIPIAKLRGAKKSTYVKGKLKNVGLPSSQQPVCPDALGNPNCLTPQGSVKGSNSVLAKVLSFQMKGENEDFKGPGVTEVCYANAKVPSPSNTYIGTMRSVCSKLDCCQAKAINNSDYVSSCGVGQAKNKSVQLLSLDSRACYNRSMGSTTHTAVIVSPMSVHKQRPTSSGLQSHINPSFLSLASTPAYVGSSVSSMTTGPAGSNSITDQLSRSNSKFSSICHRERLTSEASDVTQVFSTEHTSPIVPSSSVINQTKENKDPQFVVVGTKTSCLPLPCSQVDSQSDRKWLEKGQEGAGSVMDFIDVTMAKSLQKSDIAVSLSSDNKIGSVTESIGDNFLANQVDCVNFIPQEILETDQSSPQKPSGLSDIKPHLEISTKDSKSDSKSLDMPIQERELIEIASDMTSKLMGPIFETEPQKDKTCSGKNHLEDTLELSNNANISELLSFTEMKEEREFNPVQGDESCNVPKLTAEKFSIKSSLSQHNLCDPDSSGDKTIEYESQMKVEQSKLSKDQINTEVKDSNTNGSETCP